MTGYTITVLNNPASQAGARKLLASHAEHGNQWPLEGWPADTPETALQTLKDLGITWNFPAEGETRTCKHTGLTLRGYRGKEPLRRVACLASHLRLWNKCYSDGVPLIVFEDDSLFLRKLEPEKLLSGGWGMISLVDPRGSTRRASTYHAACVNAAPDTVIQVPWVDDKKVPQGTAGASSYILLPWAAKLLLEEARQIGGRPNDCLTVRQRFPWIGTVTSPYFTTVQGTPSQLA